MFSGEAVSPLPLLYSLQELQADLERQRRILHNAAILQARDQEERARITAGLASSASENPPSPTTEDVPMGQRDEAMLSVGGPELPPHPIDEPRRPSRPFPDSELPSVRKGRDWQPEAWTPQATRRRGG
jgi:NADH dehydrogenase [ubiquinone] 1 alpha subcomplex assembly factor 2